MSRHFALALTLIAAPALGQSLPKRIAAAPDGTVRLSFAARSAVCGNGRNVIAFDCSNGRCGRHTIMFDGRYEGDEIEYDCEPGPVRVSLSVRKGAVQSLRTYVGGRWVISTGSGVTDLGTVSARDATDFLLELARGGDDRVGEDAILPAVLADSVTVWPALLTLARDERVVRRSRRQAVFWLGQAAGDVATRDLADLVDDGGVDRDVREQAVFALSQQHTGDAVPALIRIARTHPDREVRRKALFWLGQSDDPRALALFEELLTKP
ncbi:MAG TPA: HEAT repeat domain-containing protein [Gemmatimonadales bacterium]|nr:HEAT repeat domain-containing protein [Gemmatimonadales bacterium]